MKKSIITKEKEASVLLIRLGISASLIQIPLVSLLDRFMSKMNLRQPGFT